MKQKRHIALKMKALHLKTRNEAWIFLTGFRSSLCLCLACSRSALLCCLLLKGSSPGKPQAHKSVLRAMGPAVGVTEGDEGMAQPPAGKHSTRHKPTLGTSPHPETQESASSDGSHSRCVLGPPLVLRTSGSLCHALCC